jgi:hypothetical protein
MNSASVLASTGQYDHPAIFQLPKNVNYSPLFNIQAIQKGDLRSNLTDAEIQPVLSYDMHSNVGFLLVPFVVKPANGET